MTSYSATYSPEDNKLRLYASSRLDAETYARVKAAGFKWAPKQDLFVAPTWSPNREDLLIELAGEIDDEDKTLMERQEERAERFEGYSENRMKDAETARKAVSAIADNIPFGQPILVGHHSERHARRDAEKIENGMRKAVNMWRTSQYWAGRAAGAVRLAKYKERPDVRARRIRTIEADKRKTEKALAQHRAEIAAWRKVQAINDPETQHKAALHVANYSSHWSMSFPLDKFPRNPPASQYEGAMGLWSALDGGVINATQAAELAMRGDEGYQARAARWIEHYDNRLAYERAMLAADGGMIADQDGGPQVGGAVQCWQAHCGGWAYITKVNKVSVSIKMFWDYSQRPCPTTVPLDKIQGIMTKAEVEKARADGRLVPNSKFPETGFRLLDAPPPALVETAEPARSAAPEAAGGEENFRALETQLKAGVKIAVAPTLFPTPADVAARMVDMARICDGDRVLEPSAGTGALIEALRKRVDEIPGGIAVTAIEKNVALATMLHAKFEMAAPLQVEVTCGDFLEITDLPQFDVILMNPPFDGGADIKHIEHARKMLATGGTLVAICADGPRQRRALQELCETWEELPEGTFKDQGTMVRTALIVMRKR